jgi:hypothetical protein
MLETEWVEQVETNWLHRKHHTVFIFKNLSCWKVSWSLPGSLIILICVYPCGFPDHIKLTEEIH